jgi:site-specific DNA recombinase
MTLCALYGRFSPRPDSDTSESIDTQFRDLREAALDRGWELAGEFSDPDAKGDDDQREGLWEAVSSLKAGMVLFVWKADRIARSVFLSEYVRREVLAVGARIECLHGQTDDSDEGTMLRQILSAFDEFSKKQNAKRTSAAMLSLQQSGRSMGGVPPFGFRTERCEGKTKRGNQRRKLVPDDYEFPVLCLIKEYADQGNGPGVIARLLEEGGQQPREGSWNSGSIHRIIKKLPRMMKLAETLRAGQPASQSQTAACPAAASRP